MPINKSFYDIGTVRKHSGRLTLVLGSLICQSTIFVPHLNW